MSVLPSACSGLSGPRGFIYTTGMELGTERPSLLWFWGPNSIMVVYMDPLGGHPDPDIRLMV